jgi:NSS family neurotransmitter:Na+ symporter
MDIVSIYICPMGALLAGIMFFWVAGRDFVQAAVSEGKEKAPAPWFYHLSKYVYCAAALTALIAGALMGGIG